MDKIDKLKALIELSQNDTITPKEVEKFLAVVLDFIRKAKDNFETISKENLQTIQEAIVFIEQKKDKLVTELDNTIETKKDKLVTEIDNTIETKKKDVNNKIVSDITDIKGQFTDSLTEVKKLLKEIKAIKVHKAKDGENPNPEDIVPLVIKKLPKVKPETGETIADKLEKLKGDNRLDASAIKNLPEVSGNKANGGGWRNLHQMHDVELTDLADGETLQYNSTKQVWENVFPESTGIRIYMFANVASDIGTYYDAVSLPIYTAGAEGSISTAGVSTTPTLLGSFATESGYPGTTNVPIGVFHVHYETEKVAGSNNYYSFARIYKRSSGGTETLLLTSDHSTQTASNTRFQATVSAVSTDLIVLDPTDRIVVKVYGVMLSSTATIRLYFDDATDARLEMPASNVDVSNFVPYTGATANLNMGSFDVSVADEVYGAGWNGSLEVPTKNAVYDKIQSLSSGITRSISSISSPTTAGATALTDYVYLVSGTTTITLPTALGNTNQYTIKCVSGTTTIATTSAQTIDGSASAVLSVANTSLTLVSDNSNWNII